MDDADSPVAPAGETAAETYSPWTIVNSVFKHLVDQGLHPTLGSGGPPAEPAAELLRCLGIVPQSGGDSRSAERVADELAQLRALAPQFPVRGREQ